QLPRVLILRVSPCWASHFLLFGQEKVTKEKATPTSGSGLRPDFPRFGAAPGARHEATSQPRRPRPSFLARRPAQHLLLGLLTGERSPRRRKGRKCLLGFAFFLWELTGATNRPFQEGEWNRCVGG